MNKERKEQIKQKSKEMIEQLNIYDDVDVLKTQVEELTTNVNTLTDVLAYQEAELDQAKIDVRKAGEAIQNNVNDIDDLFTMMNTSIDFDQHANEYIEDSGWLPLELNTGWVSNQYETEVPMYRKIGKLVMLRGLVSCNTDTDVTIATLPAGFRPQTTFTRWACAVNQTDSTNVQINNRGVISDYSKGTASRSFLCLAGISFFVE
jgi:hypothetical protein